MEAQALLLVVAPLRYSQHHITQEDIDAVVSVLKSEWLTQGPFVVECFERALAEYVGSKYAVAVNSGTAALHLAYEVSQWAGMSIDTSPLSFVATANAAVMVGLGVAFRDVEAATGNMVHREADGPYSGIVVPVHFAGRAAPIPPGEDVVEDACHALGAWDFDGCSRVGSCAHSLATCFSFHPVKPITTGEGGAITTNDEGFAQELRLLRSHGRDAQGQMIKLGWNYRMSDIQAALGLSQLKRCDEMRDRRCRLARYYHATMDLGLWRKDVEYSLGRCSYAPLNVRADCCHAHHLYPIRIKSGRRDEIKAKLNAAGIGAQIHYIPIHEQPYYAERFGYKPEDFPEAHAWGQEELSLPLHAGMTKADVRVVVDALEEALK